MKNLLVLLVPAAFLGGCHFKAHNVPGAPLPFASVDYTVMGETSAKACGSYAFGIDFGHLFKDEMGSAAAADPISAVMGMVPLLGGAPEVNRALYEALENMPEATNLYAPRSYVVTSGLAPFGIPIFGKRCAEVKAHGVKLGKGPVPNAH